MNIFIIGATGFVGSGLAQHFLTEGHAVRGFSRSDLSSSMLRASGVEPVRGDLQAGLSAAVEAAAENDVVVLAAQLDPDLELAVATAVLDRLAGTEKTLIFTSGSGVLLQRTQGSWSADTFSEDDDFAVEPLARTRKAVEDLVRASLTRRLRGIVIRPGMIWGPGDHSHLTMVYDSVASLGAAGYIGEGLNTYSHVHMSDVAELYSLAIRHGTAGALYHAAAGETPMRWIAESVAADLQVRTRRLESPEAAAVWGEFGALIAGASSRIRPVRSNRELGWTPARTNLLDMVGQPHLRRLAIPGA